MSLEDVRHLLPAFAAREADGAPSYPAANIRDLFDAGFIAGPLPADLGGSAMTAVDAVRGIEAIAAVSGSTALVAAMPLGFSAAVAAPVDLAPPAHRRRWAEQRERLAADIGAHRLFAACNSEKGAGGSLAATTTVATANGGGFVLTGEKILASSGRFAGCFFSTAKVSADDLPGAGVVELFLVPSDAPGVEILDDWDGFGMRATESQTVRYSAARAEACLGFPDFITAATPLQYWFCLFAAIPLGCAAAVLRALGDPPPQSAALRLRLAEATMRYEALRAYLLDTAARLHPGAGQELAARVLRTKTYVSQEATRLAADLFALGGGRHYRAASPVARAFADAFAGTALRPPLALGLEQLAETFSLGDAV